MVKYLNTKIYKLHVPTVPSQRPYVGATTMPLSKRFSKHKCDRNSCSSRQLFRHGEPVVMELLEECACATKRELSEREQAYMQSMDCVNIRQAGTVCSEARLLQMRDYSARWNTWKGGLCGTIGRGYFA